MHWTEILVVSMRLQCHYKCVPLTLFVSAMSLHIQMNAVNLERTCVHTDGPFEDETDATTMH